VGDALLHLCAQLREEHVLSRLLRRVVEENLEERKIFMNSSFSVTLWHHTGLVTSKGSPEPPGVTSSKKIYDIIVAARGPMGWRDLLLLFILKPRSIAGLARWTWPAEPRAMSPATGCHCAFTDGSVPSHPPTGSPGQREQLPWPGCRPQLCFKAQNFYLIHLNQLATSDLLIVFFSWGCFEKNVKIRS